MHLVFYADHWEENDEVIWKRVKSIVGALSQDEVQDQYPRSRFESGSMNTLPHDELMASIELYQDSSPDSSPDAEEGEIDDIDIANASVDRRSKSRTAGEDRLLNDKHETEINLKDSADVVS